MKYHLLKAQAKKKKFLQKKNIKKVEDDSDGSLSSDDEESYSENMIGKLINDKYLIIKYLGKGTYSKVWCVLDIINSKYFALKIQDDTYLEDINNEILILKMLGKNINLDEKESILENKFSLMYEYFDIKIEGVLYKCILFELLGDCIDNLFYEENDNIISLKIFKKVILDILKGLNNIHQKGIVHTDLKLDNILFKEVKKELKDYLIEIEKLQIPEYYNNLLMSSFPEELKLLDKNKRKMIKKKIKKKVIKDVYKTFNTKINGINKEYLLSVSNIDVNNEENLKLDISDDINNVLEDNVSSNCENKYKLDIDVNNINIKLVDFGNSEFLNNKRNGSIYTRSYRPPENIISETYDCKSDIWVLGCIIYELFSGELLFDLQDFNGSKIEKDRKHLSIMYSVLGKMPKELSMDCEFSEDLFDNKGRIIKNREIKEFNIKDKLNSRIKLEDKDYELLEDLLFKILEYDPKKRLGSEELLNHKFFE